MEWEISEEYYEQENEIQALSGIYMEDFEELIPTPNGPRSFRLHLTPSLAEGEKVYKSLDLLVNYTLKYPNEAPKYMIENAKNLEDEDIEEIKKKIQEQIKESLGGPMIYEIAHLIQEILSSLNEEPKSLFDQRMDRQKIADTPIISIQVETPLQKLSSDAVLGLIQGSPQSVHRKRGKSQIGYHWEQGKLFQAGRYGDLYYTSNRKDPKDVLLLKEIIIPVAFLVPANYNLNKVKRGAIVTRIQSLCVFRHENIAEYRGVDFVPVEEHCGSIQVVRQFVDGISLFSRVIEPRSVPDTSELSLWSYFILKGLEYLHSNAITHQQLHSKNVVLSPQGIPILTDFGLEQTVQQAHNAQENNPLMFTKRHDIWNLGALLLELLSFGEVHVYGLLDESQVTMPSSVPKNILEFVQVCFSGCDNATELLQFQFVNSAKPADLFGTESGSYSCEMPKNSSSRYEADFEELEFLGRGGFGAVVKARNRLDGRLYAIKKVPLASDNLQENQQILREVTMLSRLHHEHVVRYYQAWIETNTHDDAITAGDTSLHSLDTFTTNDSFQSLVFPEEEEEVMEANYISDSSDDSELEFCDPNETYSDDEFTPVKDEEISGSSGSSGNFESGPSLKFEEGCAILYIQMELCTTNTLHGLIKQPNFCNNSDKIWRLFRQIVEGLDHIHQQHMIHRDLKPPNIFLDSNDDVKIGDFGLAKASTPNISLTASYNEEDGGVGSVFYSAPEQRIGAICTPKADMYSLGIILLEMCYPFSTIMERAAILSDVWNHGKLPPRLVEMNTLEGQLIQWLIARDPDDRPSTTDLLQSELIPQQIGDAKLIESLRSITVPGTTIFSHLMQRLFSIPPDPFFHQNFMPHTSLKTFLESQLITRTHERIRMKMMKIFERRGSQVIDLPALVAKTSVDAPGNTVYLLNETGGIVMLPYDLTLPFASKIASSRIYSLKGYAFGSVFRKIVTTSHPQRREVVDFDIICAPEVAPFREAEILYDLYEILEYLSPKMGCSYHIYINHAKIFSAILHYCKVPVEKQNATCEILELRLSKSWAFISRLLSSRAQLSATVIKELEVLTMLQGDLANASKVLPQYLKELPEVSNAINYLRQLSKYMKHLGLLTKIKISFHCGTVHSFSYRNGLMLVVLTEPFNGDSSDVIAAGGSYSKLISHYFPPESSLSTPSAVGICMPFDYIINKVVAYKKQSQSEWACTEITPGPYHAMIYADFGESLFERMQVVSKLWEEKILCEYIYPDSIGLEDMLLHCKQRDIPCLLILRKHSWAQGKITLKDVSSQKEENIFLSDITNYFHRKGDTLHSSNTEVKKTKKGTSLEQQKVPNLVVSLCKQGDSTSARSNTVMKKKLTQELEKILHPFANHMKKNPIYVIATDLPVDVMHKLCASHHISGIKKFKSQIEMIRKVIVTLDDTVEAVFLYNFDSGYLSVLQKVNFPNLE